MKIICFHTLFFLSHLLQYKNLNKNLLSQKTLEENCKYLLNVQLQKIWRAYFDH